MSTESSKPTVVWFFVSRRYRIAYLQVPKAASTSIGAAMLMLDHPEIPREQAMDEEAGNVRHLLDKVLATQDDLKGSFRFTFVRNPYSRFVSFHRNKVAEATPETLKPRFVRMGVKAGMSMEAVLDLAESIPKDRLDPHIIPQSYFVFGPKGQRVDFVGRFEKLAEGMETVRERSRVALDVGQLNATGSETGRDPRESLPEGLRARLAQFYREDFERFGYEV